MFWKNRVKRNDKFVNVINYFWFGNIRCENILSEQTVLYWECVGVWKVKGSKKTIFKN